MNTQDIISILNAKGIQATDGDEDQTTVISWERDINKIREALKGLPVVILPRVGYDGGTIIFPAD